MVHDLGINGESATVLLSTDFRYFGRDQFEVKRETYPYLLGRIDALRQGHRVNHDPSVHKNIEDLCIASIHPAPPNCRGERVANIRLAEYTFAI